MYLCENKIRRCIIERDVRQSNCRHPFCYNDRFPATNWIMKIIPATTKMRWMSPPPILKTRPSNQKTISATMINHNILPIVSPLKLFVV